MKRIIYYYVSVMVDCEGKLPYKSIGCFKNKEDAISFSKHKYGRDLYGHPGKVSEGYIDIYDHYDESISVNRDEIRRNALNKLTDKEREALGLEVF